MWIELIGMVAFAKPTPDELSPVTKYLFDPFPFKPPVAPVSEKSADTKLKFVSVAFPRLVPRNEVDLYNGTRQPDKLPPQNRFTRYIEDRSPPRSMA